MPDVIAALIRFIAGTEKSINSFLAVTRKTLVMIGTLLYVLGSCQRHSEPTKGMCIPLRLIPKEGTLWSFVQSGQLAETDKTKLPATRKGTQLNLPRQGSVNGYRAVRHRGLCPIHSSD